MKWYKPTKTARMAPSVPYDPSSSFDRKRMRKKINRDVSRFIGDKSHADTMARDLFQRWRDTGLYQVPQTTKPEEQPVQLPAVDVPDYPDTERLPHDREEARQMLLDMAKGMFPELSRKGMDVKQATDVILNSFWNRIFEIGRPTLEFYEKHVEPGYVQKVREKPWRSEYLGTLKRNLMDIYESTGKDRFGNALPPPETWPWAPLWWREWADTGIDMQKGSVDQFLSETFDVEYEPRTKARQTRLDPLKLPKYEEPKWFGPQEVPEPESAVASASRWFAYAKSKEDEHLVFCYRTIKDKKVREQVWETDPGTEEYELKDYNEVDVADGFHDLRKSKGSTAKGVLLRLSKEQLDALDEWEEKYRRTQVGEAEGKPLYAYVLKK